MNASATNMRDFIEALRICVPPEVHPMSQCFIHEDFGAMENVVDDPVEVLRLMSRVRERIARELRWEAVKAETVGDFKGAWKLRRRADKFEAVDGVLRIHTTCDVFGKPKGGKSKAAALAMLEAVHS